METTIQDEVAELKKQKAALDAELEPLLAKVRDGSTDRGDLARLTALADEVRFAKSKLEIVEREAQEAEAKPPPARTKNGVSRSMRPSATAQRSARNSRSCFAQPAWHSVAFVNPWMRPERWPTNSGIGDSVASGRNTKTQLRS